MAEVTEIITPEDDTISDVTGDDDSTIQQDDDPTALAIQAALEQERDRLIQEAAAKAQEEFEARRKEEDSRQQEWQRNQERMNAFGSTLRQLRENLKSLRVVSDDGDELDFDDDRFQKLVAEPLNNYNSIGLSAAETRVLSDLTAAAVSTLSDADKEEFFRRASGKELDEWLGVYTEIRAANTNWAKSRDKEMKAAIAAAEARGFKKGQSAPPGQPSSSPGVRTNTGDLDTIAGISRALREGQITQDTFLEKYKALKEKL